MWECGNDGHYPIVKLGYKNTQTGVQKRLAPDIQDSEPACCFITFVQALHFARIPFWAR